MIEPVKAVLMRRDGLTAEEAQSRVDDFKAELEELLGEEVGLDEVEELLADHFGLEPDYLMEFL